MKGHGYSHRRINHREKIYAMGDVHTNTIEGFWSLVKRGISGFRYNRRFDTQPMFISFIKQVRKN
jgi:hypothetical protein